MTLAAGDIVPFDPRNGLSHGLGFPYVHGPLSGGGYHDGESVVHGVWLRETGVLAAVFDGAAELRAEGYAYANFDYQASLRAHQKATTAAEALNELYLPAALPEIFETPHPVTGKGSLAVVIDGQFGSTGKGLISSWVGAHERVDVAVSNAAPNAGHSFFIPGDPVKKVVRHLPVAAIFNPDSLVYLCAGSILDPDLLLAEMAAFNIAPERVRVHPRAAIVDEADVAIEADLASSVSCIASTRKGVGASLARKVMRSSTLAAGCEALQGLVGELDLHALMDKGAAVLMEVPQGLGLALNSGLSYPHCTSREITVASAIADAQVHPRYLGNVMMSLRTFPIRVGNLVIDGLEVGTSGPFFPDSVETTWTALGLEDEKTTVTQRVRRVATFSLTQYRRAVDLLRPTHVFLNFMNQLPDEAARIRILQDCARVRPVTHIGDGPTLENVRDVGLPGPCPETRRGF